MASTRHAELPGRRLFRRTIGGARPLRFSLALIVGASVVAGCDTDSRADEKVESTELAAETTEKSTETSEATSGPLFELVEGELFTDEETVNEAVTFVEEQTGRPFTSKPKIAIQSVDDFNQRVEEQQELEQDEAEQVEELAITARYLQTIGHTDLGEKELGDIVDAIPISDLAAAYYDDETKTMYIPDQEEVDSGFTFESVLVHELTHALDNQYVDFEPFVDGDLDPEQEFTALSVIEGRATSVQYAWDEAQGSAETEETPPEEAERDAPGLPESLAKLPPSMLVQLGLPYDVGAALIDSQGGADDTWELYDDLPDSSEQVFFPEKLGVDDPVEVSIPETGDPVLEGATFFGDTFGVADVLILFAFEELEPNPATIGQVLGAADGMAGGSAVLWGDDSTSCTRIDIQADSPEVVEQFETLFVEWSADQPDDHEHDSTVTDNTISMLTCAPYLA